MMDGSWFSIRFRCSGAGQRKSLLKVWCFVGIPLWCSFCMAGRSGGVSEGRWCRVFQVCSIVCWRLVVVNNHSGVVFVIIARRYVFFKVSFVDENGD